MTETGNTSPVSYREPLTEWPETRHLGLTAVVWTRIAIVAALMCALFWPNLRRLWLKTNIFSGESNWLHSPFVPALGLYFLYLNRDLLFNAHRQKEWGLRGKALAVWVQVQAMLLGSLFFVYVYAQSLFSAESRLRYILVGVPLAAGVVVLFLAVWSTSPGSLRARLQSSKHRSTGKQSDSGQPVLEAAGAQPPHQQVLDYRRPDLAPGLSDEVLRWVRDRFSTLADRSSQWFGFYILLWGLLFYAWGIWPGQNDFFKDVAMVAVLFGVTLMLVGWRIMRIAWFPILFLVCAIPWPGLMYAKIAMPLQELAAYVACAVLKISGVEAVKDGTKIIINVAGKPGRALNVAEACAGLKSLMTFITVAAAVGFLSHRALWQKLLIVASAVPIAILCNVFRVAGQGLLDTYFSQKLSDGFAHQFVGMVMLIPAFFMILFVGWLLDNLFIEEVDRRSFLGDSRTPSSTKKSLVIEIPRGSAKGTEPKAGSGPSPVPGDLVAATQRLSNVQTIRRGNRPVPLQPGGTAMKSRPAPATVDRKENL